MLRKATKRSAIKAKFGKHLNGLRIKRGLTLPTLGRGVGVTPAAVSMWENGHSQPTLTAIRGLCKILKVSPNVLIGKV